MLPSTTSRALRPCRSSRGMHGVPNRRHRQQHNVACQSEASSSSSGTTTTSTTEPTTSGRDSSKDAVLARIAAARAYKQGQGAAAPTAPTPPPPAAPSPPSPSSSASTLSSSSDSSGSVPFSLPPQSGGYPAYLEPTASSTPFDLPSSGGSSSSSARGPPARADFLTNPDAPAVMDLLKAAPRRAGGGSADEAAAFLQAVLDADTAVDPSLRPEEFTRQKEERQKAMGVDIITVDPNYRPEGASAERYQPKVTTWGVFPRPNNISEAYGGGRTIKPGEALETPEQKKKREADYAAALLQYKRKAGTDTVSDADMAAAKGAYSSGMTLFKAGQLREALGEFNTARELVPLRTKLGGLSTLQAAICYDTLGAAKEAQALYKKVQGHPTSEVSRKARHLVYGFEAMDFLKARSISYAIDKKAYDPYFRRFADASRLYVASEEERAADAAAAQKATLLSVAVIVGPLVVLAALVGTHSL